jgi:ribonuclease-3
MMSKGNSLLHDHLLTIFQEKIHIQFNDKGLLYKAFCHKSFANENPTYKYGDNQRLEFLGDSVLDITITSYLFTHFPLKNEGELTQIKNYLVSEESLASVAMDLNLGSYLLVGMGEKNTGGQKKMAVLADTLEALFAALYLDQGLTVAGVFILAQLQPQIDLILQNKHNKNFKSLLQELAQKEFQTVPSYTVLSEHGPEHAKIFSVEVMVNSVLLAKGEGNSKKSAEQAAAKQAFLLITEELKC